MYWVEKYLREFDGLSKCEEFTKSPFILKPLDVKKLRK
jgi:hypothetical protein